MIICEYNRDSLTLSLKGHSGYSERGCDIVCAAVSTLAFGLARYYGDCDVARNKMLIKAPEINEKNRAVYDAFLSALQMIEDNYPANLCLCGGDLLI